MNKSQVPEDEDITTEGTSGPTRIRSVSECSNGLEESTESSGGGKRQRTISQQFMVASGLTAASPPKFVSLEEIMQAANGMRDMALMHHIVVDDNFKLERAEPQGNSVQRIVNDTMRKAFWDVLRVELAEDPPNYTQALVLLEDVRQGLFAVLLPQHTKIKQQIAEILDEDLIKQQAENATLNFEHYAQYVTSVMAKLCAPVRDEKIKELSQTHDIIEVFKGILETLDLMKLDMANFTIAIAKPDIIACSVELERKKFSDYLAIQTDGLENTRKWLLKHVDTGIAVASNPVDYENQVRATLKTAFWNACIDLLDWDADKPYPETFLIDTVRLRDVQAKTNRLVAIGTILLVTLSNAGVDLQTIAQFKQTIKDHVAILFQSVNGDKDLNGMLTNVAEQVVKDIRAAETTFALQRTLTESDVTNLREQILQIGDAQHKIKVLIRQRVKEFFRDIIESATAAPQKVPSGLSALQKELAATAGQFLRIVSHNNTVFCIYYHDIVTAALPKPLT